MSIKELIQQRIEQLKVEVEKSVGVHNFLQGQLREAIHWIEFLAQQELQKLTGEPQAIQTFEPAPPIPVGTPPVSPEQTFEPAPPVPVGTPPVSPAPPVMAAVGQ